MSETDVLYGPKEAIEYLNEISKHPLTMGSLRIYIYKGWIPFEKKGSYYHFSKSALRQWDEGRKYHKRYAAK
jgi:hypothetical protein